MRSNYTLEKQKAARILDYVKNGGYMKQSEILWALYILGDLTIVEPL